MEGCNRTVGSWWTTSSFGRRVWWVVVAALMVVSGVVVVLGVRGSSSWLFVSSFSSYGNSSSSSGGLVKDVVTPPAGLELWPTVVGGGEREEALEADYTPNRSSAVPRIAGEVGEPAEPPHVNDDDKDFMVVANRSNVSPLSDDARVLPLSPKINKRFSNLQFLEAKLQQARAAIRDAQSRNVADDLDYLPAGPIYWNASSFHRSYLEMEKQFKVYVYEEGEQPIFHNGPCGSIYSMEGNFIYKLEISKFRTRDPEKAHVFFLPFSVSSIVHFIYDKQSRDQWLPMKQTVKDYVDLIARKYPYWNRSLATDHFMLSCHDWGPELSKSVPELYGNSIRALCNANTSEGFRPSKDISIPEINLPGGRTNGLIGGPSPSKRPILVFFAGGLHGPIRPILLRYWESKDEDVQVHKYLPKGVSYSGIMRKSKFCICPSGYEVASPRMVEALYMGCVPVLIKDHYVQPFSDVLNWKSFSVEIPVEDIPKLKNILMGISTRQYIRMQRRGLSVRKHFEVNSPPQRYDVFHMILHSIWLRRLNVRLHGVEDS